MLDARVRLPLAGQIAAKPATDLPTRIARAGAETAWVVAPTLAQACVALASLPSITRVELELGDLAGLELPDALGGRTLVRVRSRSLAQTRAALALHGDFEVLAPIDREHAAWIEGLAAWPSRLALIQPSYDLASDAATHDVELAEFCRSLARFGEVPVEGVVACLLGRAPRIARAVLDTTMLTPEGGLEIFRYARRFVQAHDRVKSLRCRTCAYEPSCQGVHVNWVRAHGFAALRPVC
ncbi:MAG: hypothetical protein IAG13_31035 [Deltaproteobacteria bacterium]|nr:hypothetical protein [Nannocystaceae bacterium]